MGFTVAIFAAETGGVAFPMRIDWLSRRYSPLQVERKPGLSLMSPNYVELNRHIVRIKFPGVKPVSKLDNSRSYFLFSNQLLGVDILTPSALSVNRYFEIRKDFNLRKQFVDQILTVSKETETKTTEKLELIGADIAGQRVSLRVSGNVNINGRLQNQQRSQVRAGFREGQSTTFVIDQKQQLSIEGKIGDRISILVDQDSERDFDWENALKIIYTGKEDDIVQKVEAGNVALSLPGTQFVTFSGKNNGLFGLKALLKFGGINVTTIASVEKGKKEKLSVDGGAQTTNQAIKDNEYRRNAYFYLDSTFRNSMYQNFAQTGLFAFNINRVVANLEVYKSQIFETAGCVYGKAYVDPRYPERDTAYTEQRVFRRLELGKDYYADLNLGYIRLQTQVQENEVIGVTYRLVDAGGITLSGEEFGNWNRPLTDTSDIVLKLIKPQHLLPTHPCWDLEFKNIYYLGTSGINEEGFDLDVVYIHGQNGEEDRDREDGKTFLNKLGLDLKDKSGNPNPDDIIDIENKNVINLQMGELWMPYLRPFQFKSNDNSGEFNPNLSDKYSCTAMYDSNRSNINAINGDHKFKIIVKYQNRSSNISLGGMVIENSEIVTLNNQTLTRGVDYTIDYFTGQLTLLRQDALNPDANLEIKFEKNQFFQLDKKTILGARAQYDFGENSFIGGTALYFGQSVIDEKVEVGYEPMRNFVWDINGRYNRKLDFMTRALDWLPLIKTDVQSSFAVEGEIAQVRPNPNTLSNEDTDDPNGVGFIDDFEGSKRITSPPIMRRYWTLAARPSKKTELQRGFTFWFNPYGGWATTAIWPNKEVSTRAQNNITEILVMAVDPRWSIAVNDGTASIGQAWGGITYFFPQSYYDQSKTKFFEIWVRGNSGTLHVDLGQISEDQDGNKVLNTEDKPAAGFTMGNNLLDEGEDTGLDGLFDRDEYIITSNGTKVYYGDETLLTKYRRDPTDPRSDNWKWREGSSDYRHINGTEGNSKDVNGLFPDTEDMNNNFVLDQVEDYYTAEFDLADPNHKYIAGQTVLSSGRPTGWKLYRIPLSDFAKDQTGTDITWQTIRACRLWFDGLAAEDSIYIAKIEMVGNEWEELGIAADDSSAFVRKEKSFAVSVINTEDNPDLYEPPKGVEGEYDRINEIRTKEQSLVLQLPNDGEGLQPGESCGAKKVLMEEASFITYRRMKIFIAGHDLHTDGHQFITGEETPLQFFIRFGKLDERSPLNYYECRQPIYPGWDKRNKMDIDLDYITTLKAYDSATDFPIDDGELIIERNSANQITRRHWREKVNGQYTGREIIIFGNPSLARVSRIDIGLRNRDVNTDPTVDPTAIFGGPVKGEVWLDELRLSEVRRDKGMAYRGKVTMKMADVANFDLSVDRRDADFHTVEQRPSLKPDGLKNTQSLRATGRLAIDKFIPAGWGVRLPVTGSYSETKGSYKFIPGTDILMPEAPPDSLIDLTRSYSVTTSFEKRASDFWLTKYTIDQIRVNLSAQWSEMSNKDIRASNSQSYRMGFSYRIPFGQENYFKAFKWLAKVPLLGSKVAETRFYYLPNNLEISYDAAEDTSRKTPRWGQPSGSYQLGLDRNLNLGYKVFDNLTLTFSTGSKFDLRSIRDDKWQVFQQFNPGQTISTKESYTFNWSPKIFSWFSPTMSYSSNYNWGEPVGSNSRSVDVMSNQNRASTSFSLDLATIFGTFYKSKTPAKPTVQPAQPAGRRKGLSEADAPAQTPAPAKPTESGGGFLDIFAKYLKKIQAFQFSFSVNNSINSRGRIGTPELPYRLGFTQDPGLPVVTEEVGVNTDNTTRSIDASLRTGVSLFSNINMPLNFQQTISTTSSQNTFQRNLTRDYFALGTNGKDGIPFPGWSVNIGQLEKYSLFSPWLKRLSIDHGYSGKETLVFQNGKEMNSQYKRYFQPLVGVSMQFKNDISSQARMTVGQTINNRSGGTELVNEMNVTGSINWQKRGGMNIPLPFLKDLKLENNITFSMNADYNSSLTRARAREGKKFTKQKESNSWKLAPKINYTFTKKVTGGLFYEYGQSFNPQTGKRTTKNYGFDINIAIRG